MRGCLLLQTLLLIISRGFVYSFEEAGYSFLWGMGLRIANLMREGRGAVVPCLSWVGNVVIFMRRGGFFFSFFYLAAFILYLAPLNLS